MKNVRLFIVLTLSFFNVAASATSFDCNKALGAVERIICADASLSTLDDELATTYGNRYQSSGEQKALRSDQLIWLKQRNLCSETACIRASYTGRIAVINKKQGASTEGRSLESKLPLNEVLELNNYRPEYSSIRFRKGSLYFSQFGPSGNNYDVLSFDFLSAPEYLVRERPGAEFVAINQKYLIISENLPNTRRISVLDRKSRESLGSIKLKTGILWAEIRDEKLIAIQGGSLGGGYTANTSAKVDPEIRTPI